MIWYFIFSYTCYSIPAKRIYAFWPYFQRNQNYLTFSKKEKLSDLSSQKNDEIIKNLSEEITKLGGKPKLEKSDQKIFFLQNHGMLIASNEIDEILEDIKFNPLFLKFKIFDLLASL